MLISMPIVDRDVLWRHGACDVSRTGNTFHLLLPTGVPRLSDATVARPLAGYRLQNSATGHRHSRNRSEVGHERRTVPAQR